MEQKKPRLKNPILLGNFGLFFFFFCQKLLLYSGSNKKTMSVKMQNDILQVEEQSNKE